ncbi:MAG: hypothetical protein HC815_17180 [Richelia sp. RM1_1_1]|nr:hypothetical protein [Richelia sp. RM1_1_1]
MFNFINKNKFSLLLVIVLVQLVTSVALWLGGSYFFFGNIVFGWFQDADLSRQLTFGLDLLFLNPKNYYVPFLEEFIFRFSLAKKVNKFWWLVSISSLFWFVYYSIQITFFDGFDPYIFQLINAIERNDFLRTVLRARDFYETFAILVFGLITGSILFWITNKLKFDVHKISSNKIFNYALIAFSSISFILVHAHFSELQHNIIYNLTFILPLAILFTYSRLKYGMITAIYMHAFANYIASYPTFLRWDWDGGILLNIMFFIGLGVMLIIYKIFVANEGKTTNEPKPEDFSPLEHLKQLS